MFCTNCGTENSDDYKFCMTCGVPLERGDDSSKKSISSSRVALGVVAGVFLLIFGTVFVSFISNIFKSGSSTDEPSPAKPPASSVVQSVSTPTETPLGQTGKGKSIISLVQNRFIPGSTNSIKDYLHNEVIPKKSGGKGILYDDWDVKAMQSPEIYEVSYYFSVLSGTSFNYRWKVDWNTNTVTPINSMALQLEDTFRFSPPPKTEDSPVIERIDVTSGEYDGLNLNVNSDPEPVERLPNFRAYNNRFNSVKKHSAKDLFYETEEFNVTGIMDFGGRKKAMVNIGWKDVAVSVGDEVHNGWKVKSISDRYVNIVKGDEEVSMMLQY